MFWECQLFLFFYFPLPPGIIQVGRKFQWAATCLWSAINSVANTFQHRCHMLLICHQLSCKYLPASTDEHVQVKNNDFQNIFKHLHAIDLIYLSSSYSTRLIKLWLCNVLINIAATGLWYDINSVAKYLPASTN